MPDLTADPAVTHPMATLPTNVPTTLPTTPRDKPVGNIRATAGLSTGQAAAAGLWPAAPAAARRAAHSAVHTVNPCRIRRK